MLEVMTLSTNSAWPGHPQDVTTAPKFHPPGLELMRTRPGLGLTLWDPGVAGHPEFSPKRPRGAPFQGLLRSACIFPAHPLPPLHKHTGSSGVPQGGGFMHEVTLILLHYPGPI